MRCDGNKPTEGIEEVVLLAILRDWRTAGLLIREENVKIKDILKLVTSMVLCQLAGFLGSLFTIPAIPTWYKTLKKPFFTPPDWIFGPVWISLFILMGVSLFMVWRRQEHPQFKIILTFFLIQLIFNILWSAAFFGLRSPLLGSLISVSYGLPFCWRSDIL